MSYWNGEFDSVEELMWVGNTMAGWKYRWTGAYWI